MVNIWKDVRWIIMQWQLKDWRFKYENMTAETGGNEYGYW